MITTNQNQTRNSQIILYDIEKRISDDSNEKEFLRMFSGRDIKSRINVWIYSEKQLNQQQKKIIKALNEIGFTLVRKQN